MKRVLRGVRLRGKRMPDEAVRILERSADTRTDVTITTGRGERMTLNPHLHRKHRLSFARFIEAMKRAKTVDVFETSDSDIRSRR